MNEPLPTHQDHHGRLLQTPTNTPGSSLPIAAKKPTTTKGGKPFFFFFFSHPPYPSTFAQQSQLPTNYF